jgi:hypothetical protein
MPRLCPGLLGVLAVAACQSPAVEAVAPTVALSIVPAHATVGEPVVLTWTSLGTDSCVGSVSPDPGDGGWSGPLSPAGAAGRTLRPATPARYTFVLTCAGPAGEASDSGQVVVDPAPEQPAAAFLDASAAVAFVAEPVTLQWAFTAAERCTASGDWLGARPTTGSEVVTAPTVGERRFVLECSGSSGTSTASVAVLAIDSLVDIVTDFVPTAATIASSEGAPYGDGDFWVTTDWLDRRHGYGPTRVVRLYICLNAMVAATECSAAPRPTGALSGELLAALDARLAEFSGRGVRLLLRFIYNFGPIGAADVPIDDILTHLDQVAPIVLRHRDHVFALQAGFIGTWGEWHNSTSGSDSPAARAALLERQRSLFGGHFPILVRYPADLIDYAGPAPLEGIGLHDDYFASDIDDGGTWLPRDGSSAEELQDYAATVSRAEPFVAEFGAVYPPLQSCQALDDQARRYHLQSLALAIFPPGVPEALANQGCLLSFLHRVGTRIEIDRVTATGRAEAGATLQGAIHLRNAGFGGVRRPRLGVLVLHTGSRIWSRVTLPAARLGLGGLPSMAAEASVVPFDVPLPDSLPSGPVTLSLVLPDPAPALRDAAGHALPLNSAAADGTPVFEPTTGWNRLAQFMVRARRGTDLVATRLTVP